MKRVAPELDCLMWALVEENNPRAVEEFLVRYPQLHGELERRGQMVNGLKQLKPESKLELAPPPPFRPRTPQPMIPRRMMVAVGALVLAALGLASFTVSYLMAPPAKHVQPAPSVKHTKPMPTVPETVEHDTPSPIPETDKSGARLASDSPLDRAIGISISGAPLSAVLKAVGAQAGAEVVVAPGMKDDPKISVNYEGMSANEIYADLGREYGFTAFDQGDGSIIVVPAVQETGNAEPKRTDAPTKELHRTSG